MSGYRVYLDDLSGAVCLVLTDARTQYSGADHTTIYRLCVQPTLNYEITENVSVGTYVLMGWALDSDVRRDWKDDENNNAFNVCWGLNLTLSF